MTRTRSHPSRKRGGFTLIELLIVITIIAILAGMSLSAANKVQEAAARIACTSKLREIGLACKNYESGRSYLPCDSTKPTTSSFLWAIRDEMEIIMMNPQPGNAVGAAQFLCPSRRSVQSLGPNAAPSDYGCAKSPIGKYKAILAGPDVHVTTVSVSNTGGTSNKIMVGHLAMDPNDYIPGDSGTSSTKWAIGPLSRDCSVFTKDGDGQPATGLGGPHPSACPFLFCDGSVRRVPGYSPDIPTNVWNTYWSYGDKTPIPPQYAAQ
jgi:prepilin-type N-terminal cleavage/methylation domain-containing protein/prepilin-type processing-associated H-X9-DG protein